MAETKFKDVKIMSRLILVAYLIVLMWILLFKFSLNSSDLINQIHNQKRSINLIPFAGSAIINGRVDLSEILQNVIIFIPFGGLLGITDKKSSLVMKCMYILGVTVIIELLQYVFCLGATDITDVVTNFTGGFLGLLIYKILKSFIAENKLDKFLTLLALILLTVALLFLGLLIFLN